MSLISTASGIMESEEILIDDSDEDETLIEDIEFLSFVEQLVQ